MCSKKGRRSGLRIDQGGLHAEPARWPRSPRSLRSPQSSQKWLLAPNPLALSTPPSGSRNWCCASPVFEANHARDWRRVFRGSPTGRRNHSRETARATSDLVHFVGIGGIGMSGASPKCWRNTLAYTVTRFRRRRQRANVKRTSATRASRCTIGPSRAENLDGADVHCRLLSAIKRDNPVELVAARASLLPSGRAACGDAGNRADVAQRAGVADRRHARQDDDDFDGYGALLDAGNLDPTVINGGIINAYGTNARLGASSDWMVVEADESDGTSPEASRRTSRSSPTSIRAPRPLSYV